MGRRRWTAAALSLTALIMACGGEPEADQVPAPDTVPPAPTTPPTDTTAMGALPPGVTPDMVTAGQAIFTGAGLCQNCHGPDATGLPNLGPNLRDDEWLNISGRNYDEIVNLVKTGVPTPRQAVAGMPPRGGSTITDQQVNEVAAYVVSLGR